MKMRIIVGVIAVPIIVAVTLFAPVWALGLVVGVIAAFSAWELLRCAEKDAGIRIRIYAALAALCIPVLSAFFDNFRVCEIGLFCLFALLFIELMLSFRKESPMDIDTVTMALFAGAILPILLSSIVRLGLRENGNLYALLPFIAAFSCDSGAYFAGSFLGRNKLAPTLSPHKTIEGSIGGIVAAILVTLLYGIMLTAADFEVNFAVLGVYGFLGALACELGDLSFSAIKRLCSVKDYGDLIPGHGGMLDRFDSMFWTSAVIELLVLWVPAIH